jgi:uroporphyrinogen-III synthase
VARVLVTRPEPHAAATAARLAAMGHAPVLAPMLHVVPRRDVQIGLGDVAAIALTSRTAVAATAALARGRADLAPLYRIPVFTVGAATAEAARAAGFEQVLSADGAVPDLVRLIRLHLRPADGAVLHLAGEARAGEVAEPLYRAGYSSGVSVVYEAVQVERLPDSVAGDLAAGRLDAVLIYSARTAEALVGAVERADLMPALARLPCLGLSAAALAPLAEAGLPDLRAAAAPNENALFALLQGLAAGA